MKIGQGNRQQALVYPFFKVLDPSPCAAG